MYRVAEIRVSQLPVLGKVFTVMSNTGTRYVTSMVQLEKRWHRSHSDATSI